MINPFYHKPGSGPGNGREKRNSGLGEVPPDHEIPRQQGSHGRNSLHRPEQPSSLPGSSKLMNLQAVMQNCQTQAFPPVITMPSDGAGIIVANDPAIPAGSATLNPAPAAVPAGAGRTGTQGRSPDNISLSLSHAGKTTRRPGALPRTGEDRNPRRHRACRP
jgi:hypothetical protein